MELHETCTVAALQSKVQQLENTNKALTEQLKIKQQHINTTNAFWKSKVTRLTARLQYLQQTNVPPSSVAI